MSTFQTGFFQGIFFFNDWFDIYGNSNSSNEPIIMEFGDMILTKITENMNCWDDIVEVVSFLP